MSSPNALDASSNSVWPAWLRPSCGRYPVVSVAGFSTAALSGSSRPATMRNRVLFAAALGLIPPGDHAQQRRLAGAVRAAQADALAIGDLPRHVVEEHTVAEGFR